MGVCSSCSFDCIAFQGLIHVFVRFFVRGINVEEIVSPTALALGPVVLQPQTRRWNSLPSWSVLIWHVCLWPVMLCLILLHHVIMYVTTQRCIPSLEFRLCIVGAHVTVQPALHCSCIATAVLQQLATSVQQNKMGGNGIIGSLFKHCVTAAERSTLITAEGLNVNVTATFREVTEISVHHYESPFNRLFW